MGGGLSTGANQLETCPVCTHTGINWCTAMCAPIKYYALGGRVIKTLAYFSDSALLGIKNILVMSQSQ